MGVCEAKGNRTKIYYNVCARLGKRYVAVWKVFSWVC